MTASTLLYLLPAAVFIAVVAVFWFLGLTGRFKLALALLVILGAAMTLPVPIGSGAPAGEGLAPVVHRISLLAFMLPIVGGALAGLYMGFRGRQARRGAK